MVISKQNKASYVCLGVASLIFASGIAPNSARAQVPASARSQASGAKTQDPRHAVNVCGGAKALEPACLKVRLDSLEQTMNSMGAQLQAIQDTLNKLNESITEVKNMIGEDDKGDETDRNLWKAISSIKERLAKARIP